MRRRMSSSRRLRIAIDRLPRRTAEAMLRGIASNRIIVGAYVDPASGGICPMLAAHRNGGRDSVASFARAWDDYTGAKRPRRATRREVAVLRSTLEASLGMDAELERTSISELAAQIRAERAARAGCPVPPDAPRVPDSDGAEITIRRRPTATKDLLTAVDDELNRAATPGSDRDPAPVLK